VQFQSQQTAQAQRAQQEQISRQQSALSQQYQQLNAAQAQYQSALAQAQKAHTQAAAFHEQLETAATASTAAAEAAAAEAAQTDERGRELEAEAVREVAVAESTAAAAAVAVAARHRAASAAASVANAEIKAADDLALRRAEEELTRTTPAVTGSEPERDPAAPAVGVTSLNFDSMLSAASITESNVAKHPGAGSRKKKSEDESDEGEIDDIEEEGTGAQEVVDDPEHDPDVLKKDSTADRLNDSHDAQGISARAAEEANAFLRSMSPKEAAAAAAMGHALWVQRSSQSQPPPQPQEDASRTQSQQHQQQAREGGPRGGTHGGTQGGTSTHWDNSYQRQQVQGSQGAQGLEGPGPPPLAALGSSLWSWLTGGESGGGGGGDAEKKRATLESGDYAGSATSGKPWTLDPQPRTLKIIP
jgi:hypothetical protein